MQLNIQLFGGRGSKSMSRIPKNKRKAIKTYRERIKEHKDKINNALNNKKGYDKITIPHWEAEIKVLQGNIDKIIRRYKK